MTKFKIPPAIRRLWRRIAGGIFRHLGKIAGSWQLLVPNRDKPDGNRRVSDDIAQLLGNDR